MKELDLKRIAVIGNAITGNACKCIELKRLITEIESGRMGVTKEILQEEKSS